jgi:zinc and cadmium transporter
MSPLAWLGTYCVLVLASSLLGGSLPILRRLSHNWLQFCLSLSAGVMLGASFFHVMPEAKNLSGPYFGWWMSLGVVGLFCIERFIAPHSHELDGGGQQHDHKHNSVHLHEHTHNQVSASPGEHRAAAPSIAGWMAVLGLTIHTFMNGVGLAGSVEAETGSSTSASFLGGIVVPALPGLAMFLAIVCHKPFDALAISTVLSRKGVGRGVLSLVQFGFALMVPLGAWAFLQAGEALEAQLRSQLTGAALAFSAGTFLFIALSDLLPEVQFHRHDRIWLSLALMTGVALMGGIALLEEHKEDNHDAPAVKAHDHVPARGPASEQSHGHPHKH